MKVDSKYIFKTMLDTMGKDVLLRRNGRKVDLSVIDKEKDFTIKLYRREMKFDVTFNNGTPILNYNGVPSNYGILPHTVNSIGTHFQIKTLYYRLLSDLQEKYKNDFAAMLMFAIISLDCKFFIRVVCDGEFTYNEIHKYILGNVSFSMVFDEMTDKHVYVSWKNENDIIISHDPIELNEYAKEQNKVYKIMEKV